MMDYFYISNANGLILSKMYTLNFFNILNGTRKQELVYEIVQIMLKINPNTDVSICFCIRIKDKYSVEMHKIQKRNSPWRMLDF